MRTTAVETPEDDNTWDRVEPRSPVRVAAARTEATRRARWFAIAVLAGLLGCGKKAHDAPVAPPAVADARALDAPAAAPVPLPPEVQARRFEECWAHYDAGEWDAYRACHAPGARFDLRGLDSWYLDVDTKVSDLKRLGIVAPGDHAAIEWALATEGGVVGIVRITGTAAGKPVELRIGETVGFDGSGRIAEDFLYFDAAWKQAASPARAPVIVTPRLDQVEQDNNAVVERLLTAWDGGDLTAFDALLADDVTWVDHGSHQTMTKAALHDDLVTRARDLPGYHLDPGSSAFGGEYVAVTGELVGEIGEAYKKRIGAKPPGNGLAIPALAVFRVVNGKVASAELFWQSAALRKQLGLAP